MKINNDIEEQYCSFNISKLLKEKGFGRYCFYCYNSDGTDKNLLELWSPGCEGGIDLEDWCINYNLPHFNLISKPTLSIVISWIRENFGIHISIDFDSKNWFGVITTLPNKDREIYGEYNTPEEATENSILYVLTNLILN